ncbi:MAG: hypothetical protein M3459_06205 [Actinomycetota bacterium]|nr:hypothetical protein [Actinomycetota bacterium]
MPALRPRDLLAALLDAQIEFVILGGLAVGFHGWPRATKDIDICPAPSRENWTRLAQSLLDLDAEHVGVGDFDPGELPFDPTDPQHLAEGGNFRLETRLGALDVMQWVPGVPGDFAYHHLAQTAVEAIVLELPLRFCSLEDLRTMKETAGRPRDLDDLQHLPRPSDETEIN